MDEMKISTKFMKGLVAKALKKVIKNKFGIDVDILLNDLYISNGDEKAVVHLNVRAEMPSESLATFADTMFERS